MFITPAFAQTGGSMGDPFTGLLVPMLLMVLIFYFLVIRPQSQRAANREHPTLPRVHEIPLPGDDLRE